MIFAQRGRRGPDPHLPLRVQLFFAAAAVALVGIALDSSWLVGMAILFLLVGLALRLFPGKEPAGGDPTPKGEESDVEEDPGPS